MNLFIRFVIAMIAMFVALIINLFIPVSAPILLRLGALTIGYILTFMFVRTWVYE